MPDYNLPGFDLDAKHDLEVCAEHITDIIYDLSGSVDVTIGNHTNYVDVDDIVDASDITAEEVTLRLSPKAMAKAFGADEILGDVIVACFVKLNASDAEACAALVRSIAEASGVPSTPTPPLTDLRTAVDSLRAAAEALAALTDG